MMMDVAFENAKRYWRENGCIWYHDTVTGSGRVTFCSWNSEPTDPKIKYYDVNGNRINASYYDFRLMKVRRYDIWFDASTGILNFQETKNKLLPI